MIRRGEIYFVTLAPARGREQAGHRPVLVVSDDAINRQQLVITVVPGSKGSRHRKDYPTNVRASSGETGLREETVFLCFQVGALDPKRFPSQPAGRLSAEKLYQVENALRLVLGL